MKVALVYDWLYTRHGGGEDTFLEIAKLYPQADIYCLVYDKNTYHQYLSDRTINTSSLQKFPRFCKRNPNLLLPFIKRAVSKINLTGYDLVISVSSAWVKNVKTDDKTAHIAYVYSPARMLWDSWPHYLTNQRIGPFKIGPLTKFWITRKVSQIRLWDYYQAQAIDHMIAISHHISDRIHKFYGMSSIVIYPPVRQYKTSSHKDDYYVIVSSLSRYKNIDLAIKTFQKLPNKRLIIAGSGPDSKRLQQLASGHSNITLLGRVSEERKQTLLAEAKAFLFLSVEDFGIAPIEALSSATPVIALRGGGLSETLQADSTGVFFDKPTTASLTQALQRFEKLSFDSKTLQAAAHNYSSEQFAKQFTKAIEKYYKEYHGKKH